MSTPVEILSLLRGACKYQNTPTSLQEQFVSLRNVILSGQVLTETSSWTESSSGQLGCIGPGCASRAGGLRRFRSLVQNSLYGIGCITENRPSQPSPNTRLAHTRLDSWGKAGVQDTLYRAGRKVQQDVIC